ncbi:MAG: glycoside hydrolase family 13 protein [Clostridiales bacterium]|nr:glycoside hydrolase family 13 protein [Clostridiales bacterium]
MSKTVDFFPNCCKCKSPLGAATVGEPVSLTLKFTRPQNPSEVYLVLTKANEDAVRYPMKLVKDEDGEYTYTISIKITTSGLYYYHFDIQNEEQCYRVGSDVDLHALLGKGSDWQLTVTADAYAPTVLDGGVMYEIMPDRFFIGGERNMTKPYATYREDWGGVPEYKPNGEGKIENVDFFGGNLKGIAKKLTYLKNLGVTCIYLTPIFEAHSNHKYDPGNYMRVDSDFGTIDDLKALIKKADKRGIKVILDGVFSHTGDDSIYFNKQGNYDSVGAYHSVKSPYFDWYKFNNWNNDYECRDNIDIMPATNENSPMFDEFINGQEGVVRYWTRMGLVGWRLDVCEQLSDAFIAHCVKAAKKENADAVVYGEVFMDATSLRTDDGARSVITDGKLDGVTNYPFKEDILNFVRCGDSGRLNNTVAVIVNNYPKHAVDCMMNVLGNHDTARLLTVLGDNGAVYTKDDKATATVKNRDEAVGLVKLASALQYTLPGVPCVYYGDEAGMEGFEDPFNRKCYPWGNADKELIKWYKKLGAVRTNEREVFAHGRYCGIDTNDGVMFFKRKAGDDVVYVVVNNSGSAYTPQLPKDDYTDLLTYKPFGGKVADKGVAIIKATKKTNFPPKPEKKKKAK